MVMIIRIIFLLFLQQYCLLQNGKILPQSGTVLTIFLLIRIVLCFQIQHNGKVLSTIHVLLKWEKAADSKLKNRTPNIKCWNVIFICLNRKIRNLHNHSQVCLIILYFIPTINSWTVINFFFWLNWDRLVFSSSFWVLLRWAVVIFFCVDCLQSTQSIHNQNFLVVHMIIIDQWNQTTH